MIAGDQFRPLTISPPIALRAITERHLNDIGKPIGFAKNALVFEGRGIDAVRFEAGSQIFPADFADVLGLDRAAVLLHPRQQRGDVAIGEEIRQGHPRRASGLSTVAFLALADRPRNSPMKCANETWLAAMVFVVRDIGTH